MKIKEIDGRKVTKFGLKLAGRCAVDCAVCMAPAAMLPLAIATGPLGIVAVIGGTIVTEVICSEKYDSMVDEIVDGLANHVKEVSEKIEPCVEAFKKENDKKKTEKDN